MVPTPDRIVRCETTNATLYRRDPEGRGVYVWCRGHHKEELRTWAELGLTREIAERIMNLWTCEHCHKELRSFEAKKRIVLDDKANKGITVCAFCHKELLRAKRIVMEYT